MIPDRVATIVFAKIPGLRIAKSRIAAELGWDMAESIYGELLEETSRMLTGHPYHVAFTGSEDPGALRQYFSSARSFFVQTNGTLGQRLSNAFSRFFEQGCPTVCAVGCDCPALTHDEISLAHAHLREGADVVIGPSVDGGYYLIGCRDRALDIFTVSSWGSSRLFDDTISLCNQRSYRVALLPPKNDIDTAMHYRSWKEQQ